MSMSLQEVFDFFEAVHVIRLQGLLWRFYNQVAPGLITRLVLYRQRAFCLLSGQTSIKVMSGAMVWRDVEVREKGGPQTSAEEYFDDEV